MKIKKINVKNFRRFKDIDLVSKNITLLDGVRLSTRTEPVAHLKMNYLLDC